MHVFFNISTIFFFFFWNACLYTKYVQDNQIIAWVTKMAQKITICAEGDTHVRSDDIKDTEVISVPQETSTLDVIERPELPCKRRVSTVWPLQRRREEVRGRVRPRSGWGDLCWPHTGHFCLASGNGGLILRGFSKDSSQHAVSELERETEIRSD